MNCEQENGAAPLGNELASGPLEFHISMASNPRLLCVMRSTISELAAVSGFKDDECRAVALAASEALANVMRHAYQNRVDQEIDLNCRAHPDCLELTIVDHGAPVDQARVCVQPLDDVCLGGRGTHMIRQIMDEVHYERVAGKNLVRLKKYLPGAGDRARFDGRAEQEAT
jgi:anti-sigma regulatory factor (Ser/Thr protein kinase)